MVELDNSNRDSFVFLRTHQHSPKNGVLDDAVCDCSNKVATFSNVPPIIAVN